MQRHTQGILYVFKVVGDDVYKVGFTTKEDPSTGRLPGVQTGNHEDLEFVHMWPGTYGEEQDLHHALTAHRSRASGKGEWYRFTIGTLIEAISQTGQALLAPESEPDLNEFSFDELWTDSMAFVRVGPYKDVQGFYSHSKYVGMEDIPEAYRSYVVEYRALEKNGTVLAGEIYLEGGVGNVWLPIFVLGHIG